MARTRSAVAHRKVLDAAIRLVPDRGVDATSMDAIAAKSGVSKATIYKHWPDKEALLLEMMAEARERLMPQFVAYSASNRAFGSEWRDMVMEPPRRELKRLMKSGVARGELSAELDVDLSLALGPIVYWHAFLRRTSQAPWELAEGVVDAFWRAFGVSKRRRRR